MKNRAPHRRLVAAAVLLCLGFTAHAADDLTAQAEATLTDLRYHLVDLRPDDGLAPSLFVGKTPITVASRANSQTQSAVTWLNPLPVSEVVSQSGSGASALAGPTTLSAKSSDHGPYRLGPDDRLWGQTLLTSPAAAYVGLWELPNAESPEQVQPEGLKLSPHTKLVIEGTALLSSYAKASAVLDRIGNPQTESYLHELNNLGTIDLRFESGSNLNWNTLASWTATSSSKTLYRWSEGFAHERAATSDHQVLPVLLELSNDSDDTLTAYFHWYIGTGSQALITAVPEPGTWALVAAGLSMLPGALRARKAKR
ncbi:MAG: PEP-CTERM sorting domain-containing protein [Rubrivivax sp.]|nr:MAG: PEP-CTERM sorting domain-containing protein [Rubrivivax sp.]